MDATTFAGLFNVFVGIVLTASILMMLRGSLKWYSRLGTYPTNRDETIRMMSWAVAALFALVIMLAVVRFVQAYTSQAMFVVGLVVVLAAAILLVKAISGQKSEGDEH